MSKNKHHARFGSTCAKNKEPFSFALFKHPHVNWALTAIANTFLILLSSALILISGSRFHTYYFPFPSTSVLYFILTFPGFGSSAHLRWSICCGASAGGCPALCHVLSTWGVGEGCEGHHLAPGAAFLPRLSTCMKTNGVLVLEHCQVSALWKRN